MTYVGSAAFLSEHCLATLRFIADFITHVRVSLIMNSSDSVTAGRLTHWFREFGRDFLNGEL
jgi:hypothetical protein